MTRSVGVLIADDEPQMLAALIDLIDAEDGMHLVGVARDARQARDMAQELQPDVALLDVKMPGGGGPQAAREIKSVSPATRIVALSAYNDRGAVVQMLRAGASGYLLKDGSIDSIVDSIRRTSDTQSFLSAEVATSVIDELVGRVDLEVAETQPREAALSRVQEVLRNPTSLSIHFQPIVELETRRQIGMEALSRFALDPRRTPDKWFDEAEQVGLGKDLEILALRVALSAIASMDMPGFVSVNVSPRTVRSAEFLDAIELVRPDRIVIEMTEHAPVEDYEAITDSLRRFRERGLRLAIDDAGAGFASLRHILRLEPDLIKLDISLTRDIDHTPAKRALAAALSTFAREIGCVMVAEGVETEDELQVLIELGITCGQGYLLGRPAALPKEPAA